MVLDVGLLTAVVMLAALFGVGLGLVMGSLFLWLDERDEAKDRARRQGW